jgi:hypothetical protein
MQSLPLELELAASQIAAQHYPHRGYKLVYTLESNFIDIQFQGYLAESFNPRNRPSNNPTDDFYRYKEIDFTVSYGNGQLSLSGWWRRAILTFDYNTQSWSNEDGEEISCPYPDGEEFEQIAAALYPLLQQHY